MPGQINPTQMTGVTAWRGTVTKENHLYHLFRQNPQKATDVMITLMSSMYLPTLDSFLSKEVPVREYDDDSRLHWDIVTSARRNIPLVEARRYNGDKVVSGGANVGAGFEPFYLVFPTDWFAIGEILFGNLNEAYPVIVKEEGRAEGTNTVYLVEPFGAHLSNGIPAERLLAGERFSYGYAPIESNLSRKVGDVRFSTPVSMSSEWQHVRIQHKVGGKEIGKRLSANFPLTGTDSNGRPVTKMVNRWMYAVTWQIEKTWSEYKNNSLDYGVSTIMENGEVSNFGLSGLANKQGAGYRQLKAMGHVSYYTKFKIGLIDDALFEMSAGKLGFNQRKFIIRTGERGAIQLSKAAKAEMSGWMPLYGGTSTVPYVKPNATEYAKNGVAVGDFQVTKWISANNVEVTIMIDSSKDDMVTNKIMHPLGGPAESYTYDICYAGDEETPNVQKCMIKGKSEWRGYQWGPFANPFTGQTDNPYASYDEDSAVVHYKATQGIVMYDATRHISLIPAILQA